MSLYPRCPFPSHPPPPLFLPSGLISYTGEEILKCQNSPYIFGVESPFRRKVNRSKHELYSPQRSEEWTKSGACFSLRNTCRMLVPPLARSLRGEKVRTATTTKAKAGCRQNKRKRKNILSLNLCLMFFSISLQMIKTEEREKKIGCLPHLFFPLFPLASAETGH